jgi:uncharacterized tellurite resistance protein B-like protein
MTAEATLPALSDSTFHMLRCVVAVAAADKMIRSQELLFLNNLLIHYRKHATVTPEQVEQLQEDLKASQPLDKMLVRVTEQDDRKQLILFAGLMAQSDGEVHPAEEEIVQRIRSYCRGPVIHIPGEAQPVSSQALTIPGFDMQSFKKEIRSIVQQEFYKNAISKSGVSSKTGQVAVADAFAEGQRGPSRAKTYDMIEHDAGRHRVFTPLFEEDEGLVLPKTGLGLKTFLKLIWMPALLALVSTQANMAFSSFTYHELVALKKWDIEPGTYNELYSIFSSPLWGTLPGRIFHDWAAALLLWKLYAMWMSGRLSPLMRKSLVPGERLLGKARFHFFTVHMQLAIAALLYAFSYKANMFLAQETYHFLDYLRGQDMAGTSTYATFYKFFSDPFWGTLPGQIMRWGAFLLLALQIVRAWTTEIVATDSRLLFRQGIFDIKTIKIDIQNLRQIDVKQSMMGLMLDFGYIHIYTNSIGTVKDGSRDELEMAGISLPPVADPHTFSTLVDRARRAWRKGHPV